MHHIRKEIVHASVLNGISGLFHRAIAQAGVNMAPWALPARKGFAREQTAKLAKMFNCYTPNNWTSTVDCLRTVPSQKIIATLYNFYVSDSSEFVSHSFEFSPIANESIFLYLDYKLGLRY